MLNSEIYNPIEYVGLFIFFDRELIKNKKLKGGRDFISPCYYSKDHNRKQIMATKSAATTPAVATSATTPAAGGAQILQSLQTQNAKLDELLALAKKHSELEGQLKNLGAAVTSMEHKLTTLDVSVKAVNAGTKRAPKAPAAEGGDATATPAATTTSTAPSGEKFPSNTLTWLGNAFKMDAAGIKAKYFSEEQQTTVNTKLTADAAYQKFDADIAAAKTDKAKDDLRYKKAAAEFRAYWEESKKDAALCKKLQDEWREAKSKFEQSNRTPAKLDS